MIENKSSIYWLRWCLVWHWPQSITEIQLGRSTKYLHISTQSPIPGHFPPVTNWYGSSWIEVQGLNEKGSSKDHCGNTFVTSFVRNLSSLWVIFSRQAEEALNYCNQVRRKKEMLIILDTQWLKKSKQFRQRHTSHWWKVKPVIYRY